MPKKIYLLIASFCLALVGFALYIQHQGWAGVLYAPCPLCILQRMAYLGIAFACLGAYFFETRKKFFHLIATVFSLFGSGVVLRHLWVIFHPTVSCGLDPLEVWINQWTIVRWFDWLLKADGLCSAQLPPVFGLSVPVWSLLCLIAVTGVLLINSRFLFGKENHLNSHLD
jgi:disulfide bond formation protein DsbB